MCGNYSREETIQGRKLYEEIRYVKKSHGSLPDPAWKLIDPSIIGQQWNFKPQQIEEMKNIPFRKIAHNLKTVWPRNNVVKTFRKEAMANRKKLFFLAILSLYFVSWNLNNKRDRFTFYRLVQNSYVALSEKVSRI